MKTVLHVGCGGHRLPDYFGDCVETRLDINPVHRPDIVASMTDMGEIGPFDAVFSSHSLEHLPPFEVGVALQEFRRVLKPKGVAIVIVPDLEDVKPTAEIVYESLAGPITGFDMYYGHRTLTRDDPFMAHRSGFVADTLRDAMADAGFTDVRAIRAEGFNLVGVGVKA